MHLPGASRGAVQVLIICPGAVLPSLTRRLYPCLTRSGARLYPLLKMCSLFFPGLNSPLFSPRHPVSLSPEWDIPSPCPGHPPPHSMAFSSPPPSDRCCSLSPLLSKASPAPLLFRGVWSPFSAESWWRAAGQASVASLDHCPPRRAVGVVPASRSWWLCPVPLPAQQTRAGALWPLSRFSCALAGARPGCCAAHHCVSDDGWPTLTH